jgi:DNA repair exonuclease SbcCD nuclease subunit
MPCFLHTADWQIGRQYGTFPPEDAVPLAEARLAAVQTIARLASDHAVDAVLVAGDVFDAQTVAERTIRQLFNALQGYAGPWIMIPGNHDAALAESVWTRAQRLGPLPSNLHLALQPQVLDFGAQGFAVLAAPLTQRHTYNDLTEWFDSAETPSGLLRIGLAHGGVQGVLAEDLDSANPIGAERAARARLDYLALGDWHGCKRVDARTWYSGTPEPDRFKANDPGKALLVALDGPGAEPRVTPLPTSRHDWQAWTHTLAVASDLDALIARLAGLGARDVLNLHVDGQTDIDGLQRLQAALKQAEAQARSVQAGLSALRLRPSAADLAALHADGYLGEVVAELRDRQAGTDTEQAGVAAHALALLAGVLADRRPGGGPARHATVAVPAAASNASAAPAAPAAPAPAAVPGAAAAPAVTPATAARAPAAAAPTAAAAAPLADAALAAGIAPPAAKATWQP